MMSTSAEAFWDRHAPKYLAKPIADLPSYEAKLKHVRSLLQPTDTVLEIGCGSGRRALQLAPYCASMTASDISSQMIKCARGQKQSTDVKNVRFVHANATRAFSDTPIDNISAFSLLHLVPDIQATLGAVHHQLKPVGLFISKTVCLGERNLGVRTMVRFMKAVPFTPDFNLLSQSGILSMIQGNGFEIIEARYFGGQRMDPFIVARRHG